MKAFKAWMCEFKADFTAWEERGNTARVPVLVIDATDFPPDYPEIGSEWLSACDYTQRLTVKGAPVFCEASDVWLVPVKNNGSGITFLAPPADLRPIPETVTGEVVGTVTVGDSLTSISCKPKDLPEGTYDIVRRP